MEKIIDRLTAVLWAVLKLIKPSKKSCGPDVSSNKSLRHLFLPRYLNRGKIFGWGMKDEPEGRIDFYKNKNVYLALLAALKECYGSAFEWDFDRDLEKAAKEVLEDLRGQYTEALRLDWDPDDSESLRRAAREAVEQTSLEYLGLPCINAVIEKFKAGAPDSWGDE